jgi:chromosome segregation ATPase
MAIKFNQVILNKLQKNKTELSKKVSLTAVKDLEDKFKVIDEGTDRLLNDLGNIGRQLESQKSEIQRLLDEVDNSNDIYNLITDAFFNLGVDVPSDIYSNIEQIDANYNLLVEARDRVEIAIDGFYELEN